MQHLKLFSGNSNPGLARAVCHYLDSELGKAEVTTFSDGECAIEIGENVWLGARVIVLPGVTIGAGSVVAAGSVVGRIEPAPVTDGLPDLAELGATLDPRFTFDTFIVGKPNAGKSSLHARLTGSHAVVGPYPFATKFPLPGMLPHEDVQFQLVDLPPVSSDYIAPWTGGTLQNADAVLLVSFGGPRGLAGAGMEGTGR